MSKKSELRAYIRLILEDRDIFEQIAEESAELIQACIKSIRASGATKNITPKRYGTCMRNLHEEMDDVCLCMYVLGCVAINEEMVDEMKLRRWAERLGYKEHVRK